MFELLLQIVGFVALVYLAIKFLPDFLWFMIKFLFAGFIIFWGFIIAVSIFYGIFG